MIDHADNAGPTRQHELDHTRWGIDLPSDPSDPSDIYIMRWESII